MLQAHVVRGADKNICLQLLAGEPTVQHLVARSMEPMFHQVGRIRAIIGTFITEGRAVAKPAHLTTHFTKQRLEQLTHRHTRWQRVWVDDEVGADTICREGHVPLSNDNPDGTLLSRARSHFITDGGNTVVANSHFGHTKPGVTLCHESAIYEPRLSFLGRNRCVRKCPWFCRRLRHLANEHSVFCHGCVLSDESSIVELCIIVVLAELLNARRVQDIGESRVTCPP